jgi:hypothetical protein
MQAGNRSIVVAFFAAVFLAIVTSAPAATITWGSAQHITGDGDVSTAGTLVTAVHFGGPAVTDATVNGVTFTGVNASGATSPLSLPGGAGTLTSPAPDFIVVNASFLLSVPFSSLSSSYQNLLGAIAGAHLSGSTMTLNLTGLTIGDTYQFQFWENISTNPTTLGTTATAGNSVTALYNTGVQGGVGQFAIGTFTADAGTESIAFASTSVSNDPGLNAFQLRQTASATGTGSTAPLPPGAWAGLLGIAVCGAAVVRVKRVVGRCQERCRN